MYWIKYNWDNLLNLGHTLDSIYLTSILVVQCLKISLHDDDKEMQYGNKRTRPAYHNVPDHYNDVKWAWWRLKSPASWLFTQSSIQAQIKENIKVPRHWPLCGEFTLIGEFPAQRASNAEIVSNWWRHHVICTHHRLHINKGNEVPAPLGRICNRWQNINTQPPRTYSKGNIWQQWARGILRFDDDDKMNYKYIFPSPKLEWDSWTHAIPYIAKREPEN